MHCLHNNIDHFYLLLQSILRASNVEVISNNGIVDIRITKASRDKEANSASLVRDRQS